MADNLKEFGSKLRALREKKGLGLRELAGRASMSHTFLSRVEAGKQTPPDEEKLRSLASALEFDPDVLLAMSGRISADVVKSIRKAPEQYGPLLRGLRKLGAEQLEQVKGIVVESSKLSRDLTDDEAMMMVEQLMGIGKMVDKSRAARAAVGIRVEKPVKVKFSSKDSTVKQGDEKR